MALFKKKAPKEGSSGGESAGAKPALKGKVPKTPKPLKAPKPPKVPKRYFPPDIYTLFLGLSAAFLLAAVIVLWLNYSWYTGNDVKVVPLNWTR